MNKFIKTKIELRHNHWSKYMLTDAYIKLNIII